MKKLVLLATLALGFANMHAQTLEQKMYIDFGSNAGTNGLITPSPDVNGNYWNNPIVANVGTTMNIMNATNVDTGYDMEVTNNFIVNSSVNYGPTTTNATALGDLAISTATMDYWFLETAASGNNTGAVAFKNLDPAKLYKFYVFASRPTTNTRKTLFVFTGANTFTGEVQTSNGTTGNIDTLLETTMLSPTAAGQISLDVSITQNGFGYLNIIRLEEYSVTAVDAPVAAATQTFCSGSNPTVAGLTATGATGATLNWYEEATGGTPLTATTALAAGNYFVSQVIDGNESPRAEVTVVINATPAAPIIAQGAVVSFCEGGSTVLHASAGTAYTWFKGTEAIGSATSSSLTVTEEGVYTVIISENGCTSPASGGTTVTINAAPEVDAITGPADVAAGQTIQLANATSAGTWSSENTAIATVNATGLVTGVAAGATTITYTVTQNGCSATAAYTVTVNNGEVLEQTMYIDFGSNAGTNGLITPSPDMNGHYWNNPTNGAVGSMTDIVNANNADTGFDMEVTDNFIVNTSINYGPTAPNAALLGDLAISTATMDYFYIESGGSGNSTGAVKFKNLNPTKGYKFYVFASRPTTTIRKTAFAFAGLTTFNGQIQTSNGTTGNIDTVLATTMLMPNAAGEITVSVSIAQDVFGYMNTMKIEEYGNLPITEVASVSVDGADITASGQTSQMTATVLPADATFANVSWSVDNTDIAVINAAGILSPVSNGTVVVKATSAQNTSIFGTKSISITNQATALYFSGTATENGDAIATAIPMHMVTGTQGTVSNVFEIYTSLSEAGTFNFYTSQDAGATVYGGTSPLGSLAVNGAGIDPTQTGPVLITVNLTTNTYTITPINWSVVGSSIANGWSGDAPLTYQGGGVWSATLDMTVVTSDSNPRFVFKANQSWNYTMKKVAGSQRSVIMEAQATEFGIAMQDIDLRYGNFIITLDLSDYTYGIECVATDDYKISFMGSSGMNGQGAVNMQGYAYQYNQLLMQRATEGSSPFYRSNISVNGNNTTSVLNRFEKDLHGDCGKYVAFGLVLGNEGVHETGQVAYNSYETNLQLLIQMARDEDKVPVVMNNYSRADYNLTDYNFIKQMNLQMAQWDVPSTNLLGALDSGTGTWATGYQDDALHPNTAGHTELFYAIVPSLFDALEAEKPQPVLSSNTYVTPDPVTGGGSLSFDPDAMIHPFTVSFDVQTTGTGNVMAFTTNTTSGTVAIDANGFVKYTSPSGSTIMGTTAVNDGAWHKVTLTHYYARGATILYQDATAAGSVNENLEAQVFTLHGTGAPANVNYRNWFFYRSGMNELEIEAMNNGAMLKSSLELYAPMDREAGTPEAMFTNLAQSTSTIDATAFTPALGRGEFSQPFKMVAHPNPVKEILTLDVKDSVTIEKIEVYNPLGMVVTSSANAKTISLGSLQAGIYIVKAYTQQGSASIKIIKE